MEQEILKGISEKFNVKEEAIKIMFEKIKDMGYNIKDLDKLITEYFESKICY